MSPQTKVYGLGVVTPVNRPGKPPRFRARVPDGAGGYEEAGRYDDEDAAWSALRGLAEKRSQGELVVGGMTLRRWGIQFLDRREGNGNRNIATDRCRWASHVESAPFIDWQIEAIRPPHVATWIDSLGEKINPRTEEPFSGQTIRHCVALLRRALQLALNRGLVPTNAAAGHELPALNQDGWTYLVASEIERLCNAPGIPLPDRLCAQFAIGSGLRQGEQWTLHLADVHAGPDEEAPHVVVRYGGRKRGKFTAPKNGKTRRVELFGLALDAARAWLELLPTWAKKNPHGLMWPTRFGAVRAKQPRGWARKTRKGMVSHLEAAGLHQAATRHDKRPVTWHALRHTCASALVSGMWGRVWTLSEVMGQLGHKDTKVTLRYAHLAPGALAAAAKGTGGSGGSGGPNLTPTWPSGSRGSAENSGAPSMIRTCDPRLRRPGGSTSDSEHLGATRPGSGQVRAGKVADRCQAALEALGRGDEHAVRRMAEALQDARDALDALAVRGAMPARAGGGGAA